jgi:hypothetical protein
VDAVAAKEPLNGMLRCLGLSHELPKRITSCSEDKPSIGGPSLGRLMLGIFDRSGVFENTDILTRTRSDKYIVTLIWGNARPKFGDPEQEYRDKHICVTGKITDYKGVPEIVTYEPSQIKIQ